MIVINNNNIPTFISEKATVTDNKNPLKAVVGGTNIALLPKELIEKIFEYLDNNRHLFACMQINEDWYSALRESDRGIEKLWKRNCLKFGYGDRLERATWKQHFEISEKIEAQFVHLRFYGKLEEDLSNIISTIVGSRFFHIPINIGSVLCIGSYYWTYKYLAASYITYAEAVISTLYIQPLIIPYIFYATRFIQVQIPPVHYERYFINFVDFSHRPTYIWHEIFRHLKIVACAKIANAKLAFEDLKAKEKAFCEKSSCTIL